jgi:hypothetical protein
MALASGPANVVIGRAEDQSLGCLMANPPISFAKDIKPLFRAKDINSMKKHFDLSSYQDVQTHAAGILQNLTAGSMPCDGAWPEEHVGLFRRWVEDGLKP